jgi:tetratricopeptide (TPR) repeat protein
LNEDEIDGVVKRYEDMVQNHKSYYFDVSQFEDIIDHYIENNHYNKAIDAIEFAGRIHPEATPIQLKQAQVLINNGQASLALKALSRLEKIEPSNSDVHFSKSVANILVGDLDAVEKEIKLALELNPDEKNRYLHSLGMAFIQNSNYSKALEYFILIYNEGFRDENFLYDLAYASQMMEQTQEAIHYYNQCLDVNPFLEIAWYNIGVAYAKENQNDKALEAYDFAIAILPTYTWAFLNKGLLLFDLEKYAEAIPVFKDLLEIEPLNPEVLCYLGESSEKLGYFENASRAFDLAKEINPDFAPAWFGKAGLLVENGNLTESVALLQKAIELDNQNDDFHYMLAVVNLKLENYDTAETNILEAIRLNPKEVEYRSVLAEVFYVQKNYVRAAAILLGSAFELNNEPDLIYEAAGCFYDLGNFVRFAKLLYIAVKAKPELAENLQEDYKEIFSKFFGKILLKLLKRIIKTKDAKRS